MLSTGIRLLVFRCITLPTLILKIEILTDLLKRITLTVQLLCF